VNPRDLLDSLALLVALSCCSHTHTHSLSLSLRLSVSLPLPFDFCQLSVTNTHTHMWTTPHGETDRLLLCVCVCVFSSRTEDERTQWMTALRISAKPPSAFSPTFSQPLTASTGSYHSSSGGMSSSFSPMRFSPSSHNGNTPLSCTLPNHSPLSSSSGTVSVIIIILLLLSFLLSFLLPHMSLCS
jgi:hypothetical protein